jgi:hypothetical protein
MTRATSSRSAFMHWLFATDMNMLILTLLYIISLFDICMRSWQQRQ